MANNTYFTYIQISNYIYIALLLVSALIGVFNFQKLSTPFKILTCFILITFADEMISSVLVANNLKNHLLYTLYTPLHFLLLSSVFFLLFKSRFNKRLILILGIAYTLFYFFYLFYHVAKRLPFELILIDAFFLVTYSVMGYYQLLQHPDEKNILKNSSFWLYSSIIIFFSGSFIHWISYPFLLGQPISFTIRFYFLGWLMNLIQYSLMLKSILQEKNNKINAYADTNK